VDQHPRFAVDLTGNGTADLVGFGDAGVWTALGNGDGTFAEAKFVLASFGQGMTVVAISRYDRIVGSRGIWRSTDSGATWQNVHQFPPGETVGQLEWAQGSDHLVYAAGGSALAISEDGGATFRNVFPWGTGPAKRVNHVAVWQNEPSDPAPAVIYALGDSTMFVSVDGGKSWMQDKGTLPRSVGAAASSTANGNAPKVIVVSPRWPLEVYVAGNGTGAAAPASLYRGDYSQFPLGNQTSTWEPVVLSVDLTEPTAPHYRGQDSGMAFLATTRKGRGDLLFYGAQRRPVYVGPLYPTAGSEWHPLDDHLHVDLHGILLSPDFEAMIEDGTYRAKAGTLWLLSDGGIYRSTADQPVFEHAENVATLSVVNVAGVAIDGKGPAFSLNTGDNDGFYSDDGAQTWSYQDYGGGDNDCSFADPLRPNSILVFTPRWSKTVTVYETSPGSFPNLRSATSDRHMVPGPPFLQSSEPPRPLWNAISTYGNRGSRPIVLGLPGEPQPPQGDYVFILNPTTAMPQLVRTQNILDIKSRDEWVTTANAPGQGTNVYLQGPPLPGPNLAIVQASGGHGSPVFFVGGAGQLWSWTEGQPSWTQIVPRAGVSAVVRFFVDPYRPNLIYVLDQGGVKRSDDGGSTWLLDQGLTAQLTWNGKIAISTNDDSSGVGDMYDTVLSDMQFDPSNALVRFAVGEGGAFATNDGGTWKRLLHSGALAGRPTNCFYDWISNHDLPALYVAFAGRSMVRITGLWPDLIL
ncbi:MAG TPA: hypothetical protein VIM30_05135, partial [Candidatus Limnocylindrales bacterium]